MDTGSQTEARQDILRVCDLFESHLTVTAVIIGFLGVLWCSFGVCIQIGGSKPGIAKQVVLGAPQELSKNNSSNPKGPLTKVSGFLRGCHLRED